VGCRFEDPDDPPASGLAGGSHVVAREGEALRRKPAPTVDAAALLQDRGTRTVQLLDASFSGPEPVTVSITRVMVLIEVRSATTAGRNAVGHLT
jgi:hypothetical protein